MLLRPLYPASACCVDVVMSSHSESLAPHGHGHYLQAPEDGVHMKYISTPMIRFKTLNTGAQDQAHCGMLYEEEARKLGASIGLCISVHTDI